MDYFLLGRILLSFLAGAIPFAIVAMWGTGLDITQEGSRNPGFNNVLRVAKQKGLSKWRAVFCLAGDVSKGFVALGLLARPGDSVAALWAIGLAAIVGHCWTPFLGLKGGKGVATTVGVLLYLEWKITLASLIIYPVVRGIGRRLGWGQEGAIASLVLLSVITAAVFALRGTTAGIFAAIALAISFLRHTSNLREVFARARSAS